MALTDLQIRKLRPRRERYEVADGGGLSVRVMPTKAKSWVFRYRFDGRPRKLTLGAYSPENQNIEDPPLTDPTPSKMPPLTLAEARGRHAEARALLAKGIDPGAEKQAALDSRKADPTFREMLEEFWREELQDKKSGAERKRLIAKDALPEWGSKKIGDITRRDIVLLADQVRTRAPIGANRFLGVVARFFNFCAERGVIRESPAAGIRRKNESARSRVLSDEELKLFWDGTDLENKDINIYRPVKLALRMILFTGQRPVEVTGATWAEIGEDNYWTIPAERSKNKETHRVPITKIMRETLDAARIYSGDSPFIFASSFKSDSPIDRHSLSRAIKRHYEEMGFTDPFVPHDLRRTARTRFAELGISDIVAERVLGHKLQGMLGIYNRHSYDAEKREALEKWESRLKEIVAAPSFQNVISIRRQKGA
jgi:integrase